MFAKIEKTPDGKINHAFFVYSDESPDNFQGTLINDGVIDNLIRYSPLVVLENYYWDNELAGVYPRQPNLSTIDKTTITADSIATATITNIPSPSTISVANQQYEVTDNSFEFTLDLPGTYKITVSCVACLDKVFQVIAT